MQTKAWLGCALMLAMASCGVTDPRIVDCGDDCPGGEGGNAGEAGGTSGGGGNGGNASGAGGTGGAGEGGEGAGSGGSGTGGESGSGGGTGGAGTGGTGGLDGGLDGGDAGSTCGPCDASTPHCTFSRCVECFEDAHCAPGVCRVNVCEDCDSHGDCKDPATARCNFGQCVACVDHANCSHLPDAQVCSRGRCVQCTDDDKTACGFAQSGPANVCDVLQGTCTTFAAGSANLCDRCVSDEQCRPGQLCVLQRFDDPTDVPDEGEQDVGWFCLWEELATQANAPDGDCANVRPFFDTITNADSVSGEEATVCGLRVTTCPAYKDYSTKPCADLDDDETCGDLRFDGDGMCEMATSSTFRCTTPCLSADDCRPSVSCDTSQTVGYCEL